ncbi:DUF72 domain-containing protein [Ramlibacter sp.]|uniref:DUF72 domain-containing protein n=1 Tax=Ramlibacter sp. TaxID=1917967 RepID=UPI00185B6A33|nr:DUF72 domain-containing protein [Ramlibacter sp.]MBA2673931.1 DUF72 domain-containing protein [Ramlibacter sp.]
MIRIGCAGWSLPRAVQQAFGEGGSHLQRYATRLNAAEINSSFHRPHARSLYERWADSVPADFRFSAKLPKTITHERRLVDCEGELHAFLGQVAGLGTRLACLLVQLPPSLAFDADIAARFLETLRNTCGDTALAMEPRHASWFTDEADGLLQRMQVARVLADPVRHAPGQWPGGWPQRVYLRLHGSPRMYYSSYPPEQLQAVAHRMRQASDAGQEVWCIFDNTASGAAADNALALLRALYQEQT